ncbi:MAG: type III pantothenate kinase [Gallionella sp.]|nr:type III pantothenate kinase [Gallionella sp.]
MKLLIDAGNTRIKWALVDEGTWLRSGVLPVGQAGELSQQFAGLEGIRQVWASNVAGEEIAQHIRAACGSIQPRFIVAQEVQCGVRNGYSSPAQLGSDRWAALIAAWHLVRGTCLVVNSGTATTVDALSAKGEFIGGLILPGVELMRRSLCAATDQLQAAQAGKYASFPLNTADALYSGALQASCGAIERQHALLGGDCPDGITSHSTRLSKDDSQVAGYEPGRRGSAPVVLSGGAEEVLRNRLNVPLRIVDNLVLQGLWLIAQETSA